MFTLRRALAASIVAAAVYGYTNDSAFTGLYGAALTSDCKEPCDDTYIHAIIECDHLEGMGDECRDDRCTINNIRYLKCTPEADAGSGAADCDWDTDPNDWGRWVTVREMPCTDGGDYTHTYGECEGSPYASEFTPCVTNECYGTLFHDAAEEMNRPFCN